MREVIIYPGEEAIQGYINALKEDGISVPEEKFETIVVAVWANFQEWQEKNALKRYQKLVFLLKGKKEASRGYC